MIEDARRTAQKHIRSIMDLRKTIPRDSGGDPTFRNVWLAFEREKLGQERFRLFKNRRELYYRAYLWNARMSWMSPAL